MRRSGAISLSVLILALIARAQTESIFRTTTQLVQIDVAAEDKDGHPVIGLSKEDFEVIVNRKPQPIDTFTETLLAPPAPPAPLPRGTFSNRQTAAEVTQGRYTVFLLDWRNTAWQLQSFAYQQLQKMLAATPPENKVALYLIDNGFQIVQEFTLDRDLFKARADSLWGQVQAPVTSIDQAEVEARETVQAFQDIAKHLAGISGQKLLIWVSLGFPDNEPQAEPPPGSTHVGVVRSNAPTSTGFQIDIDKAVHILGNSNVVVEAAESSYLGASVVPGLGSRTSYVNTLQQIAERTGGRFFPADTNDLAATLRSAASDRAASYELGYYASGDLPPGLQSIEIRCRRPGVTLRYREGYFVEKKTPAPPATTRAAAQEVLERAVDAVSIPLTAAATRTMGNIASIVLRLTVDASAINLRQDGGTWRGNVSCLARFASDVGDQLGDVPLDAQTISLTDAQHDRAVRDGIHLRFTMKMPPDAAALRVLVRDENSGNMGSVTIPVADLPEF